MGNLLVKIGLEDKSTECLCAKFVVSALWLLKRMKMTSNGIMVNVAIKVCKTLVESMSCFRGQAKTSWCWSVVSYAGF